ncbi:autotransporter domain-containing protein [Neomegalonema perideroedes]|uniref:autotransporter domain-containing protein n=1 Tax=Neomegalonema perideroedes TaxID=217219 RepID=UPI000364F9A8|nr:autotransporter domain-containing protein [Neomegalonema perideroedes]
MSLRNRRAALMAGAALGLLAAQAAKPAAAQSFQNFVVFGDSLVDSGQRIDPGQVYPGFPLTLPEDARWRYTNREANGEYGQPYSGRLSEDLGFGPLYPSNPQTAPGLTAEGTGLNYGVGGALAAEVRAQIESTVTVPATPYYPATTSGPGFLVGPNAGLASSGSTLALVSAGGNDVRDMANVQFDPTTRAPVGFRLGAAQNVFESDLAVIQSNIVTEMGAAAAETAAGVRALRAAGVDLVIVPNVPNLAATPETALLDSQAPALAAGLGLTLPTEGAMATPFATIRNGATQAYNGALNAALAEESGVMRVDLDGFFSAALANPASFGFADLNHSQVCYNASEFTGVPCAADPTYGQNLAAGQTGNPLVMVFNDGIHPTTTAHGAVADLIGASLEAGPKVSLAPQLPLRAARDLGDAFEDAAERGARIGGVSAFGALGASIFDAEGSGDSRAISGHAGAAKALSPSLTIGAGLGYHTLESDSSGVEIDGDAFMGGLFARHDDGRFFGTATLAAGYADLDVARLSKVGAAQLRNEGSADGWVFGGAVQAGARLIQGPGFTAGPLARLEGWSASLGGYAEGGPAYLAQSYGDLDARSFRGGLGGFVEARGENLGLRAEALFEHEFSDARNVHVSSAGLGGGWSAPGHALEDDGLKLDLTALYDAGFGLLSAGYAGRYGDDQSHGLRLGLSMPF